MNNKTKSHQLRSLAAQMDFSCACGKQCTRRSLLKRHKWRCVFGIYKIRHNKRKAGRDSSLSDSGDTSGQSNEQSDNERVLNNKTTEKKVAHKRDRSISSNDGAASLDSIEQSDDGSKNSEEKSQADFLSLHEESDIQSQDICLPDESSSDLQSDQEERSEYSNENEEKYTHFPFPNMETAMIYLWAHVHPRLSKRKIQALLDVLHAPGFTPANVPKTVYHLQKYKKGLPTLNTSK